MNSYRQVLVHLDAGARNIPRLRAARTIGQEQGAALSACYAVTSSFLEAAYGADMAPGAAAIFVELDQQRRDRARKSFDLELREPGPSCTWSEGSGMASANEFTRQALFADLVVLGQHDASNPSGTSSDFNESVILGSGKPALVLPYTGWKGGFGGKVAIAWKETAQAARAVAAALPLLQRAGSVHVLDWAAESESGVTGERLDLKGYLHLHGIEASWDHTGADSANVGEMVLSRTCDLGADLLVMGCYGHSRARELVLGGMSRTILKSMTLPVLMAH